MKIAAAYIRVSTDEQLEYSPDSQLKLIREYASSHDMTLPEALIFREADGVSGRSVKRRPQFQRMIAAARAPENHIEAILVWKFSRFARNQEESIVYKSLLRRERGIPVISVSEPIDPASEFGSLIERIIEWMDGYYSTRLSGEVKRGMAERFSRGEHVSIPPFGYRIEQGRFAINPPEADVVQRIFTSFAAGAGYQTIARDLNRLCIRTGSGGPWEGRAVEYILRNPAYIGKLRWNPSGRTGRRFDSPDVQTVQGYHQPIISEELWERVQARADSCRRLYSRNPTSGKSSALLQGLLRCSACGRTLAVSGAGYQCSGYVHARCDVSHYVSAQKLDRIVLSAVCAEFGKISVPLPPRNCTKKEPAQQPLENQLRRAHLRLERIRAAYADGTDTLDEYRENKRRISLQITALEQQISNEQERALSPNSPHDKTSSQPEQSGNLLLRILIDHITIDRSNRTVEIYYSV